MNLNQASPGNKPGNQEEKSKKISGFELLTLLATSLYHMLYFIGTRILRQIRRTRREIKLDLLHIKWFFRRKYFDRKEKHALERSHKATSHFQETVIKPFLETAENLQTKKQTGQKLLEAIAPAGKAIGRIANYIMPILGIAVLWTTTQYFSTLTYALRVEYNGEYIGYVLTESEFIQAEQEVRQRMVNEIYLPPEKSTPIYTMESVEQDQLSGQDVLVNNIIAASGNQIQEATGLYVENQFIGSVADGDELLQALKKMKDAERLKQGEEAQVSFVQDVKIEKGLYPVSSIEELPKIEEKLSSEVKGEEIYYIEEGDSPSIIADKFGVPTETLLELNPEVSKTMLIGDPYLISNKRLFLQKQVVKTEVIKKEVPFTIETEYDKNKNKTYNKVVQTGSNGVTEITSQVVYIDGYETERNVISKDVLIAPVNQKIVVGSLSASVYNFNGSGGSGGTNKGGYIWPVNGGYISEPIWGYPGHTGTDIAAKAGTTIWAAKSGTVSYSGWSTSYGYNVRISHPDGTRTLYAHCSSLAVVSGQHVNQGDVIAYVGRTGNATGNHCHFEIIDGGFQDARKYIGTR